MIPSPLTSTLPSKFGRFNITVWPETMGMEPVALSTLNLEISKPVMLRIHSECITGDNFGSLRCDCGPQKELSLQQISDYGNGVFLYLRQEGRGIGLYEKIKTYQLQDNGVDTYDANELLGHEPDSRKYEWAEKMLNHFGVSNIILLSNNPQKKAALESYGFNVVEARHLWAGSNEHNSGYLETKRTKFNHDL